MAQRQVGRIREGTTGCKSRAKMIKQWFVMTQTSGWHYQSRIEVALDYKLKSMQQPLWQKSQKLGSYESRFATNYSNYMMKDSTLYPSLLSVVDGGLVRGSVHSHLFPKLQYQTFQPKGARIQTIDQGLGKYQVGYKQTLRRFCLQKWNRIPQLLYHVGTVFAFFSIRVS